MQKISEDDRFAMNSYSVLQASILAYSLQQKKPAKADDDVQKLLHSLMNV